MLFLLRAVLVIGVLSYLAATRGGADPAEEARKLTAALPSPQSVVPAVLAAMPAEPREHAVRDVLARGLMAELARQAAQSDASPVSRDTLEEADRRPAWRGTEPR